MGVPLDQALAFVGRHQRGVLVTLRRSGRPQLSNVIYASGADGAVRVSLTDDRAKTRNLRRDPRASLHVAREDFFAYVVLDGEMTLTEPARAEDDPVVDQLVDLYRSLRGEHPDWGEYRRAMVSEARLVGTLVATYAYGMPGE